MNTKTTPKWKTDPEECKRLTMELIQNIEDLYMEEFKLAYQDYINKTQKEVRLSLEIENERC